MSAKRAGKKNRDKATEPDPRARKVYGEKLRDLSLREAQEIIGGGKARLGRTKPGDAPEEANA